jgi:hypothetical protein
MFHSFTSHDWKYWDILPINTLVISEIWVQNEAAVKQYFSTAIPKNLSRIEVVVSSSAIVNSVLALTSRLIHSLQALMSEVMTKNILDTLLEFKVVYYQFTQHSYFMPPSLELLLVGITNMTANVLSKATKIETLEFNTGRMIHPRTMMPRNVIDQFVAALVKSKSIKKLNLGTFPLNSSHIENLLANINLVELNSYNSPSSFQAGKSLKKLGIFADMFWLDTFRKLKDMKQLESLKIVGTIWYSEEGREKLYLPNLKVLKLSDRNGACGSVFHRDTLENLESLTIRNHRNLASLYLKDCPSMKSIKITNLSQELFGSLFNLEIQNPFPHDFLQHFPNLEHLHLDCDSSLYSDIERYTNSLKSLTITNGHLHYIPRDKMLLIFEIVGKASKLETFTYENVFPYDLSYLTILKKARNLKRVIINGIEYSRILETGEF